jgi:zinc transport system substrate-binding protein
MKKLFFTLLSLSTLLSAKMQVAVSIAPQEFFVQKIAGDKVDILTLVKPGTSPATYSLKPSQLKALTKSKLYFTIGVAFEKNWLYKFKDINPKLKFIDTTKGIKKLHIEEHNHDGSKHEGLDPHIWLDPNLVKSQIMIISQSFMRADPKNEKFYFENANRFIKELEEIDADIKNIFADVKQKEFIVFHPSFGYFAKAYGLKQIAIEKEGKEPSVRYIKKVVDFAKKEGIKTIFVAPQFSQKSAKQIAKLIDADVKTIDPLSKNWSKNILEIAKSFGSR